MAPPRTDYLLSQLDVLEAESIHIMREVAAEFERPVLLFSGGKDSIVMLALAERAFAPAQIPFPVMHMDTGHNFPEVLEFRDRRAAEVGTRLIVASVQDSIDAGRVVEETGRFAIAQPAADDHAAGRDRRAPVRRRVRRGPAGRGEGPGQGAGVLLPGRVRPVGPEEPAARAVEPLQHPDPPGRAHPGVPAVQLDRAGRLAVHRPRGARAAVHLLRAPAAGLRAGRDPAGRQPVREPGGRRAPVRGAGPVPHGGRHERHRRGGVERGHGGRRDRRDRRDADHRARADPGRRPVPARPPWRTASGRATSR